MELGPPDPPLADGVIALRPWRIDDVAAITAACQDPETARWTTIPEPYTEADARAWVERCKRAWSEGAVPLAVTDRATDELVAAITMWTIRQNVGEFGYWAVPAARGLGHVPRALRLLCAWAFDERGFERLQLGTFPGNTSSESVAEKVGFQREGLLRGWMVQRGERRDVTMWSLLPGELART
ncbi:MAG: GNAT family N-acetyltransferase [Actinobacteria bacterium]|nr:GNAT family N-acetyltransferase [Actinomycetota bacterium]